MQTYIVAAFLALVSTQVFAELVADTSQVQAEVKRPAFGPPDETDKTPIEIKSLPTEPEVVAKPAGCVIPDSNSDKTSSPVKVFVDQQNQTISISTPDLEEPWESKVSTGGGLKIPNGKNAKGPYCARTPAIKKLIRAVPEADFEGSGCTADQIHDNATVFRMYHTNTFSDENKRPIPMPNAIRINQGIFFHEVPPSYAKLLGKNVSGECVRLTPKTAKFLREQIEKYGAIEVTISEPPDEDHTAQYCDERMVARARADIRDANNGGYRSSVPIQSTGSEGVYGGVESLANILSRGVGGLVNGLTSPFRGGQ